MSKLLVTIAIGRNVARFDASQSKGARLVAEAIEETGLALAKRATMLVVERVTSRLAATVESAYTQAIQFAAGRMMGRKTTRTWGNPNRTPLTRVYSPEYADDSFLLAEWYPLSVRQIRKQHGGSPKRSPGQPLTGAFFVDTGKLRSEFKGFARQMVKNTGVVSVKVRDETDTDKFRAPRRSLKTVAVADVRITLMPRIYPSQLPGLKSGRVADYSSNMRFERALGLSEESIQKLRGPVIPGKGDLYHRPLLQPVFTYWTLYRLPGVVEDALTRGIVNQKLSKSTGVADFSSS